MKLKSMISASPTLAPAFRRRRLRAITTESVKSRTPPTLRKPDSVPAVPTLALLVFLVAAGSTCSAAPSPPGPAPSAKPWGTSASLALKEEFDDNVYLQDRTALGDRASFVTTAIPAVGVRYATPGGPTASLSYAPELVFFHSEPEEDHVLHRFGLGGTGSVLGTDLDFQGSIIAIDGSDVGPTYTDAGGAPAGGGPRIRDRRDATIYRGAWKATRNFGGWLVRPVATAYLHDFQTRRSRAPGYVNYVDRHEVAAGLDSGWEVAPGTRVYLGYRFGWQDQAHLYDFPEEDDARFQRVLAILEGSPWPWMKAALTLGPEFRRYGDKVPTRFGSRNENNLYVDSSLTLTPSSNHVVTASVKLFEQPGFLGRAAYEDLIYDLAWRWRLGAKTTLVTSGRAYNTDFHIPTVRNDWIFSGSIALARDLTRQLQAEISYTHESADSLVEGTPGREYTRNVVALGFRYKLR